MDLKDLHDKWLAEKPEGAEHEAEGCPHCNPNLTENPVGGGDMKTYTETEFNEAVQAAVASALTDAQNEITNLKDQVSSLTEAASEAEEKSEVAKIQAELDKAEVRVSAAEEKYNELVAYLQAEADAAAAAAELAEKREARRVAMKEHTSLSDEKIEERLDLWVAMEDEAFEAHLEDLKALSAAKQTEGSNENAGRETAMNNVRNEGANTTASIASEVFGARNRGVDIRNI